MCEKNKIPCDGLQCQLHHDIERLTNAFDSLAYILARNGIIDFKDKDHIVRQLK